METTEPKKQIVGYCEVSYKPIYEGDAFIEDSGKLYIPEYYEQRYIEPAKEPNIISRVLSAFRPK